jgi:hypothetical protein
LTGGRRLHLALHFVTIRHAAFRSIVAIFGDPPKSDRTLTMQIELKRGPADPAGRARPEATDERSELALLAEFIRADSVAALAGDIAERLGAGARGDDLIAAAGLGLRRRGC